MPKAGASGETKAAASRLTELETAIRELVTTHQQLGERITGALWLATKKPGVWLLEVMPDMPRDSKAEQPMEFLPSKGFRYQLNLLLSREEDFRDAIKRSPAFAAAVAAGKPIPSATPATKALTKLAKQRTGQAR